MNQEILQKINAQMTEGKTAEAAEELKAILAATPDDWDAKLMLGTCSMLNGDLETAQKLHAECAAHFADDGFAAEVNCNMEPIKAPESTEDIIFDPEDDPDWGVSYYGVYVDPDPDVSEDNPGVKN